MKIEKADDMHCWLLYIIKDHWINRDHYPILVRVLAVKMNDLSINDVIEVDEDWLHYKKTLDKGDWNLYLFAYRRKIISILLILQKKIEISGKSGQNKVVKRRNWIE